MTGQRGDAQSTLYAHHADGRRTGDGLLLDVTAAALQSLGLELLGAEVWGSSDFSGV